MSLSSAAIAEACLCRPAKRGDGHHQTPRKRQIVSRAARPLAPDRGGRRAGIAVRADRARPAGALRLTEIANIDRPCAQTSMSVFLGNERQFLFCCRLIDQSSCQPEDQVLARELTKPKFRDRLIAVDCTGELAGNG